MRFLFAAALLSITFAATVEECLTQVQAGMFETPCLMLLFSKLLGYGMVSASLMLKFPQILKIVRAKSIAGLSLTSFYVETLGFSLIAAYNIHNKQPFSTYGENVTLTAQCCLQVLCYWYFGNINTKHKISVLFFFVFAWILPLFSEILPQSLWIIAPNINLCMNFIVKGSQILTNWRNGSTGQLSFITNFMNFGGTSARIFTTFTELKDPFLLFNYSFGTFLNAVIVFQLVYYWNVSIEEKKEKKAD
ncbi:unnamed protein product [Blepharisma stoltei]|uniref:Mannose-P-dolichol utilization defect 1 protein homolog n=1 Tax=Blepharisma stoltei TaxID=1481888 RepID=A0AAU9JRN3_9CILI|nr:unnamed protein product [Blepharisma stoltei]